MNLLKLTGYNRCYASQILNQSKLLGYVHIAGQTLKYIRDHKKRRKKKRYYDHDVLIALKRLWKEADYICSKRLAPYLEEYIDELCRLIALKQNRDRETARDRKTQGSFEHIYT